MSFIYVLMGLMLIQGCAEKSSTPTDFKMTLGAATTGLGLNGGLILTGTNGDQKFSVGLPPAQLGDFSIELADGTWNFKAVGWLNETSEGFMTGGSRCGFATSTIEGENTTVSLSLSQSSCQDSSVANYDAIESTSPFKFKTLNLDSCLNPEGVFPDAAGSCQGGAPKLLPGKSSSIRISFPGGSNFNTPLPSLTSQCYNLDGFATNNLESGRIKTQLRLPASGDSRDFPFTIKSYDEKNCQRALDSYPMPDGLDGVKGVDRKIDIYGAQMILVFADNNVGKTGSPFTSYSSCNCASCAAMGELYDNETCGDCSDANPSSTQTQCFEAAETWTAGTQVTEPGVEFLPFVDCGPGCYPKTNFTPKNPDLARDQIRDAIWEYLGSPWLISPDSYAYPGTSSVDVFDISGGELRFIAPDKLGEAANELQINITGTPGGGTVPPTIDCKSYGVLNIDYDSDQTDPASQIASLASLINGDCYGITAQVINTGNMSENHMGVSFGAPPTPLAPNRRAPGHFNKMRDVVLGPLAAMLYQKGLKTKHDLCDPAKDGRYTHRLQDGTDVIVDIGPMTAFQPTPNFSTNSPHDFEKSMLMTLDGSPQGALYYNCASNRGVAGYLSVESHQGDVQTKQMFWKTPTPGQEWVEVTSELIDPDTSDIVVKEYFLFKASGTTPDWDAWFMKARPSENKYIRVVGNKAANVRAQFEEVTSTDSVITFRNSGAENEWTTDNTLVSTNNATFVTLEPENVNVNVTAPNLSLGGDFSMDSFLYNAFPWSLNTASTGNLCPSGYVLVPGNATLGTNDFCVMKYEAKDDGLGNAISQAQNAPWVNISQTDAKAECTNLGAKYDLISNPEWMTIARNLEAQDSNWSLGTVGNGCLFRGHNGVDDACGYSTGGSGPDVGTARDTKARHLLSNGKELWDFSGNVGEWTDWSMGGGLTLGPTSCAAAWTELPDVACGDLAASDYMPGNPSGQTASTYNNTFGLGELYGGTGGAALRGGYFLDASAGVFAMRLNSTSITAGTSIGFRCVYRP